MKMFKLCRFCFFDDLAFCSIAMTHDSQELAKVVVDGQAQGPEWVLYSGMSQSISAKKHDPKKLKQIA